MVALNDEVNEVEMTNHLPEGEYLVQIVKSQIAPGKKDPERSKILTLQMSVIEGKHKGRFHFQRLNIENPKEDTKKISLQQLKKIGTACGIDRITDTDQLHNKPFVVRLGIGEDKGWGIQNTFKGAREYDPVVGVPSAEVAAGASESAGGEKRPWG